MNHFESLDQWAKENPPDKNPMVHRFGRGPDKAQCLSCSHIRRKDAGSRKVYKCLERGVSNSAATDHRLRWNACAKYEVRS